MVNEIFKSAFIKASVAATSSMTKTSIKFTTQDNGTAKLVFNINKDNLPLPLGSAATAKIFLRMADGSTFEKNASIIDPVNGQVEYILQEEINHPGVVKGEMNVYFSNGQSMTVCQFQFTIEVTLKDRDIVPLAEYYVKDFESLKGVVADQAAEVEQVLINTNEQLERLNEETGANIAVQVDAAKKDTEGVTHNDLPSRLDAEFGKVTTQLEETGTDVSVLKKSQISVASFSRSVPENDDTGRINRAIQDALSKGLRHLFLPPDIYTVNGTIEVTEPIMITGVYGSEFTKTDNKGCTLIVAGAGTTEPVMRVKRTIDDHLWGFKMMNVQFLGSNHQNTGTGSVDRPCLYFEKIAREFYLQNINICGFKRQGIHGVNLYDGNAVGVTIIHCGTDNLYPALHLSGTGSDNSNALKWYNLHIEFSQYMLLIDNYSRHNYFIGCKFEAGEHGLSTKPLFPPMRIAASAEENSFTECQFVMRHATEITTYTSPSLQPYFFKIDNNLTRISDCDFSTPGRSGAKWINHTGSGLVIHDNTFYWCWSDEFPIILGNEAKFHHNTLYSDMTTSGIRNVIKMTGGENEVTHNTIKGASRVATSGIIFKVEGINNIVEKNKVKGAIFKEYDNGTAIPNFFKPRIETNIQIFQNSQQAALVASTWTKLLFDSENLDILGEFDPTNARFVAKPIPVPNQSPLVLEMMIQDKKIIVNQK